jgi:hypothetical protein
VHELGILAARYRLSVGMTLRTATIIVGLLGAAVWIFVAFAMFGLGSDPATRGLDEAGGYIVTTLFLTAAVPALSLAVFRRAPKTAVTLALVFPVAFAALFVLTMLAFA